MKKELSKEEVIYRYRDHKGNDYEYHETHKTPRISQCENCYYTPDNPFCRCKGVHPSFCPNMQEDL